MRDFTVKELQRFLEMNQVPLLQDPPSAQIEAAKWNGEKQTDWLQCEVFLQESVDGLRDKRCAN